MNGACFVTGQRVIDLIELGFNDTSTLNCDDDVVNLYDSAGGTDISSAAVMANRFNDTSTLNCDDDVVNLYDSAGGTYISSAAVMDSRGDKREGQWRKENE